ncbi:MAG: phytanoyl-CoA dioxygenase family protein [Cyanobacteriota bacterium]|nr:phytanoyl-CoA dioxygenase family protein [Cyanobacteriota bacterium]
MTFTVQLSSEAVPSLPSLLAGPERDQRAEQITLPFSLVARSKRSFLSAAWTLRRHGVLVLRQAVEPERLQLVNREVNQLLAGIERSQGPDLAGNAILNLPDKRSIKGYDNFVDAQRAVINYRVKRPDGRSGSDAGMVDIFHPERLSDGMATLVESCLHERLIARLLLAASWLPMRVKCRNLYVSRGVQDTRGYHCDGRSQKFKSFVFLSDVRELSDGPYCYVPTTHRDRRAWKRSKHFNALNGCNRHEYTMLQGYQALPMFAQAGDMVISSQRGAHRGHPQHPEARRSVLVNMYQR